MSAVTARGARAREQILVAGMQVLLEDGPEALSLRRVARVAGYAPSALYNHFADRDTLVIALAVESVGVLASYLQAVPQASARQRLLALGEAYLRFAADHPQEYRVIFDCLRNPPHSWNQYVDVAHPFSLIVAACAQGVAEGVFVEPPQGPSAIAYAVWALVDGHVHLRSKHLANVDGPYEAMFDSALTAMLDGFSRKDLHR
jgi:AcrR family transcriptional regulator